MDIWKNKDLDDLDNEIWKDIDEYNGDYQVSNYGRIKSFKYDKIDGIILKQIKDKDGYLYIRLCKNGMIYREKIHRLTYRIFKNVLNINEHIHHIDKNKENNYVDNLLTISEHKHLSFHKSKENNPNYRKRRPEISEKMSGENNPRSILTEQDVIKIIKLIDEGILTQKEIAKIFGVYHTVISKIKNKRIWKHIKCIRR